MLDGAAKIAPLIAEVKRLGMPAVAITDHGNVFGAYEFHAVAKKVGVKPVIGIEAYVAPASRYHKAPVLWGDASQRRSNEDTGEGGDVSAGGSYSHMTMWATDAAGLRNLFRLSSRAWLEGFYRMWPRMDDELLAELGTGIIASTSCASGEVQTRLRLGQYNMAVKAAAKYQDIFGKENYFLELMDHGIAIERRVRDDLLRLGKKLDMPPLVTNDSHYVTEDQAESHDALLCIGTGKELSDPGRFKFSGSGYYIKPAAEMRGFWDSQVPGACDNSLLIAERVGDYSEVFAPRDLMPEFPVPAGETESSWLRKETLVGARHRHGADIPADVAARIDYELDVIDKMGFPGYFLVVADICRYARENGIGLGPGRGSATGSIVAYFTGITELDPIEHQLLFERFLNPERITMPDVDLDFDDRRRGEVIDYVSRKYGSDRVCQIITFNTIKAKAAIKDSCRILGLPYALGDKITKAFPDAVAGHEIPLKAIFDTSHERHGEASELRALYEADPDAKRVIDKAKGIEGLIRGTGVHAAGVILSKEPLPDVLPIFRPKPDGPVITGFPFTQVEDMGLLKIDFLGLRNLTVINDAVQNIKTNRGIDVDICDLPLDDAKTYELLARGDTLGVFQLDGGGMRTLLKAMRPTKFTDIAAVSALYRPGPMEMNAHTNYALRKTGQQQVEPIHRELKEALEPILGDTYHLVVFQEQVMAIAQQLAGYSLGAADILRRAMGKKKKAALDAEWDRFSAGMAGNGFSAEATKAVWDVLVPFSGYGFNKSHTAGYGVVSYRTAWLKANYPAESMAALLTSVGDDKDKLALYLSDCRRMGVNVLPPDVNSSELDFTPVGDDVRFGLGAIRNVGENVVAGIAVARGDKGRFTSFADFLDKVPLVVCNKRVIESLAKAGAFDSLGHSRASVVSCHEHAIDVVAADKRRQMHGEFDLFADMGVDAAGLDLNLRAPEWPSHVKLAFEREMLGLYVSAHPLDGLEHVLAENRDMPIGDLLSSGRADGAVKISGIISKLDRKITKQGNTWAIVTVEDFDGGVECLYFPNSYKQHADKFAPDRVVSVSGRINERDGQINIYAETLEILDVSLAGPGKTKPVVVTLPMARAEPQTVDALKKILESYPGGAPVHVRLTPHNGSGTLLMNCEKFQVEPSPAFWGDVKGLLGPGAMA